MLKDSIKEYLIENYIVDFFDLATHVEKLKEDKEATAEERTFLFELIGCLSHKRDELEQFFGSRNVSLGDLEKYSFTMKKNTPLKYKVNTKAAPGKNMTQFPIYLDEVFGIKKDILQPLKDFLKDEPPLNIGEKTNKNKAEITLLFKQFPKALEAIARCSEYGHEKYKNTDHDYLNFKRVPGGSKTYGDASLRHRLEQGSDSESGLPHTYHVAWNALAELQLWIEENKLAQ